MVLTIDVSGPSVLLDWLFQLARPVVGDGQFLRIVEK